jgi:hypothetical protein
MEKYQIPNFDDKDLAIIAIAILGIAGLIAGGLMKVDAAVLFNLVGLCVTGIAALATGKKIDNK